MNTTYLILLILVIIYIPTYILVRKSEWAKSKGIVTSGPLIMIKTQAGIKLMDKVAKYRRFWRAMGIVSRFITLFLMVFIVSILVLDLIAIPRMTSTGGMGIEYALAIPGLNPMLPIVYGWIGLIIAMVVHEFAHGVQSRANDIEVESTGIIHAVVPLGAFVEPNEEQIAASSRGAKVDLYAAGITTNFILGMVMFILLFGGMTAGMTTDHGESPAVFGMTGLSPASDSGIPVSAIVLSIDGYSVTTISEFNTYINEHHYKSYDITYLYHDETKTVSVPMGVYIESVVNGSPSSGALNAGSFIVSMCETGGTPTYFGTPSSFTEYMKTTVPGNIYDVTTMDYKTGEETVSTIMLGERNGIGYLGVSTTLSGFNFVTPNMVAEYSVNPFYGRETITDKAMGLLSFVGNALHGYSPIPETSQWWYHSNGVPDSVFWVAMTLLYWIFWLNMVLGITNAIPAIPFDGGFLFMGGIDWILDKTGMKDKERREKLVDSITKAMSAFMIFSLALVIVIMVI